MCRQITRAVEQAVAAGRGWSWNGGVGLSRRSPIYFWSEAVHLTTQHTQKRSSFADAPSFFCFFILRMSPWTHGVSLQTRRKPEAKLQEGIGRWRLEPSHQRIRYTHTHAPSHTTRIASERTQKDTESWSLRGRDWRPSDAGDEESERKDVLFIFSSNFKFKNMTRKPHWTCLEGERGERGRRNDCYGDANPKHIWPVAGQEEFLSFKKPFLREFGRNSFGSFFQIGNRIADHF